MTFQRILIALCIGWTLCSLSSCNFTSEQKEQMIRSKVGKDFFRDSEKWGKVVTTTPSWRDFSHIMMDGNADIHLYQGDDYLIEVTGNELAIKANDILVEKAEKGDENVLYVKAKPGEDIEHLPSIRLDITVPDLRSVVLNGEGDFEIKDDVFFFGDFAITINSDGDVEASNLSCEALSITINGDGDVVGKKFDCTDVHIQMNGDGDITTDLKGQNIDLQLSGDGEANLDVKCTNLNVSAGGNGEVKLKGKCVNMTKQSFGKASLDSRRLHVSGDIIIK